MKAGRPVDIDPAAPGVGETSAPRGDQPDGRSHLFELVLELRSERELDLAVSVWLALGFTPLARIADHVAIEVSALPMYARRPPRTFAELVAAKRADLRKKAESPKGV